MIFDLEIRLRDFGKKIEMINLKVQVTDLTHNFRSNTKVS